MTGNPLIPGATRGLLAEYDMLTFDAGNNKLMLDQSGNGNDALFNLTPTVTAEGVSFNGTYYADVTLPVLTRNFSYATIFKGNGAGYHLGGSYNVTDQRGSSIRTGASGATSSTIYHGRNGNTANGPTIGASIWVAIIVKMNEANQARVKALPRGILGYTNSLSPEEYGADDRTLWRIGGAMQTSGGDHTVIYQPLDQGTIAWFGIFDHYTSEEQDEALLTYLQDLMTPRSITIAP
jgi:hypothetical protein